MDRCQDVSSNNGGKKELVRPGLCLVLAEIIYEQSVNCVIEGAYHMNLALCRACDDFSCIFL